MWALGLMRPTVWPTVALLALLTCGCLASDPPEPAAAASGASAAGAAGAEAKPAGTSSASATGDAGAAAGPAPPAVGPPAPPPPPTVARDGFHFSACAFHDDVVVYRHEWAAALVPPEYRQANVQAGNNGEAVLELMECQGIAVGNGTFLDGGHLAFFAVDVEAPADVQGPSVNQYLLAFATDRGELVAARGGTSMPLSSAAFTAEAGRFAVSGDGFGVAVEEAGEVPQALNRTWIARLHWKDGDLHCWVDTVRLVDQVGIHAVFLEGTDGAPAAVAGPAHRTAGAGSHGAYSGGLEAPRCA
jgi:hypothetical protein